MTTNQPLSDDELRDALRREPSSGLAWLVADAVFGEVTRTPQRRRMPSIAAWLRPADRELGSPARTMLLATTVACLVVVTTIAALLVGALLQRPSPLRNGAIAVAPPEGGVILLGGDQPVVGGIPGEPGTSLVWSPDGGRLAFWSGGPADPASKLQGYAWQLAILDERTGTIQRPTTAGTPGALEPNGPIQWSADGRRLLAGVLADGSPTVLVAEPDTGRLSRLGAPDTDTAVAAWSPDGRRLAFVAERRFSNDWRLYLASAEGAVTGAVPVALPPGIRLSEAGAQGGLAMQMGFPLAWSPDGRRLLVIASSHTGATTAVVIDVDDGSASAVIPSSAHPVLARWSPDGSSIAFLSYDPGRLANDLDVVGADGSGQRRLAEGVCGLVEWSPDGGEVMFDTGFCDGAVTIAVRTVRPDGSGARTVWSEPRPIGLPPLLATSASVGANESVSASWQGLRP